MLDAAFYTVVLPIFFLHSTPIWKGRYSPYDRAKFNPFKINLYDEPCVIFNESTSLAKVQMW